jgi:hypothetical protein
MDDTTPKPFVLVLMPFSKDFDDIYTLGMKAAAKDADVYCQRVDEQMYDGTILERIYTQIAKADIIVADMTGRNANVFYEVGYAHALGKRVILLTQKASDIPFDLIHYPHIVYEGRLPKLVADLSVRLKWFKDNPIKDIVHYEFNLRLFVHGVELKTATTIQTVLRADTDIEGSPYIFQLDVHNPTQKRFDGSTIEIGVVTSDDFKTSLYARTSSVLPDDKCIHIFPEIGDIFPTGWRALKIGLIYERDFPGTDSMIIRVFTEFGISDFPLEAHFSY